MLTEIHTGKTRTNPSPSNNNNCLITIKFDTKQNNRIGSSNNDDINYVQKNEKDKDSKSNYIFINEFNSNNLNPDILLLSGQQSNQSKNRRNSKLSSNRASNANISELKNNFIPTTLIIADKIKIPALLGGKSLNDSVSEEEQDDSSEETIKDTSFFEEISVLYTNQNNLINEKYSQLTSELSRIGDIEFNVFKLSAASNNQELFFLMNHLFSLYNFDSTLKINKNTYRNYFLSINQAYRKNSYHNSIHGCDVTQTIYFLIKKLNVDSICTLSDLELFSVFFASAIHDVDHPGNNNNWEIAIKSSLALSYNDKAVLENYHICKAFCIARKQDQNVFSNFSLKEYNQSRGIIISTVLSTDMANHFPDLASLNAKNKNGEINQAGNDKQFLLNQLVHASDISNPMKPIEIYKEWVERVFTEFFNQGDMEKANNIKVSFLCDRNTTNIIDSQIGFIDGIVFPLFDALSVPFPNMKEIGELIISNKEEFKKMKENGYKFFL